MKESCSIFSLNEMVVAGGAKSKKIEIIKSVNVAKATKR